MGHLFVGRDPHRIEELWHEAYRSTYFRGDPVYMRALSAVEMALWDIKGKALGVPVYQLLGGKVRDSVPCYANGWFALAKTPDEFAAKAREAIAAGFAVLKWNPFGSAYLDISKADLHLAIENVAAVRDTVGDKIDLLIKGHGRFNIATAVRIARARQERLLIPPAGIVARGSTAGIVSDDVPLSRALGLIRVRAVQPIQIDEIACLSGVSRRALENRLQKATGRCRISDLSPIITPSTT